MSPSKEALLNLQQYDEETTQVEQLKYHLWARWAGKCMLCFIKGVKGFMGPYKSNSKPLESNFKNNGQY